MKSRDWKHCDICDKELVQANGDGACRCKEHKRCDDCGTTDFLIIGKGMLCRPCDKKRIQREMSECEQNPPDTNFQDEVVCPWCGYVHGDSWEISDGEFDCRNCGNGIEVESDVEVSYTTTKTTAKKD